MAPTSSWSPTWSLASTQELLFIARVRAALVVSSRSRRVRKVLCRSTRSLTTRATRITWTSATLQTSRVRMLDLQAAARGRHRMAAR